MCASTPKLHKHPEAEGLIRQPDIGTQIKITLTAMIPFGVDKPNTRRFRKAEFPRFSKSRIIISSSSSSDNTGIMINGRAANNSFRLQDGKLYKQTSKTIKASIVQFDYQGRILWQSAVQHFTPGEHMLDVPETSTRSIYRLVPQR